MAGMAVIHEKDMQKGRTALAQWRSAAMTQAGRNVAEAGGRGPAALRLTISPEFGRPAMAMAVRYSLYLLELKAPGEGVEVRVAPRGAVKILDGPASDPHNLTPPDVIELTPDVWLRLVCGITCWREEYDAGHISAVGERDDLSALLPLPSEGE